MQTFALTLTCLIGTVSFACLLASVCALLAPDEADTERFQEKIRQAQPEDRWQTYLTMRRESLPLSKVFSHWRSRPIVRRLFWIGVICFLLALLSGRFT